MCVRCASFLWFTLVLAGEWLGNQNHGELDDMKLVDGVTGETLIYRRRGEPDKQLGLHQQKPVRRMAHCEHAGGCVA